MNNQWWNEQIIGVLIAEAGSILHSHGVDRTSPELWDKVKDWLRSSLTQRSPHQASLCYLDMLSNRILEEQ